MANNKDIAVRLSLKDGDVVRRGLMQLGDDGKAALARIERSAKPASRGLIAVSAATNDLKGSMVGMTSRLGAAGSALAALGPAGIAVGAGVGATVLALRGAMGAARQAMQDFDALDDAANTMGFGVERLQELRYAAEQSGVTVQQLEDGIRRMTRRIGLFAQDGGGPAAKAFESLGIAVVNSTGAVRSSEDIFDDVTRKLEGLETQAQKSALASQIFGDDAGPKLTLLLNQGSAAIQQMAARARELGLVIDAEMIKRGADAADKLTEIEKVIDARLNVAFVDFAPVVLDLANMFATLASWVASVSDSFRDLNTMSLKGLKGEIKETRDTIAELEDDLNNPNWFQKLEGRREERIGARLQFEREKLKGLEAELTARTEQRQQPQNPVTASDGGGGVAADKRAATISKVTDSLKFQLEQIGRTDLGRKYHQQLQAAGITADEAEAKAIYALVDSIHQKELALEQATAAEQASDSAARKAVAEQKKLMAEGAAMTRAHLTLDEQRAAALENIARLHDQGAISAQTATRARLEAERVYQEALDERTAAETWAIEEHKQAEARRLLVSREAADGIKRALDDYADSASNAAVQAEQVTKNALGGIEDAFVALATKGEFTFNNMVNAILADLARLMTQQQITGPLASFLSSSVPGLFGGGGSSYSGGMGAEAHTGGIVGPALKPRPVDPSWFDSAKRYHQGGQIPGLKNGEVPIIAMRGERVLTEAQQANTAATIKALAHLSQAQSQATGAAPQVSVQIHNHAPGVQAEASAQPTAGGGMDLTVMIEKIEGQMTRNVARGEGMAKVLEGRYSLNPAAGAKR